jgi:molybdate transport system permease protein
MLSADEIQVLLLSLKVSLCAVALSLPAAIAVAFFLARWQFIGKAWLDAFIHLPLVLPPVVVGYLLLLAFGREGPIGRMLLQCCDFTFAFRWTGAALSAGLMGFPLMVRAVRLSFESVDSGIEAAARTLGAGPLRTFFTVSLPLASPGILTGALLSFARGLGEFGATITFVSSIPGETRTLPLAIYEFTQQPDGDAMAWRLSLLAVALSLVALLTSEHLVLRARRKVGGHDPQS